MNCKQQFFAALRRDRLAGLWLAVVLLLVPFIQPLSEALVAGKPFAAEICSTFGTNDKASAPVAADDCPDCISGSHAALKAFLPDDRAFSAVCFPSEIAVRFDAIADKPGYGFQRWLAPPGQAPPSAELI